MPTGSSDIREISYQGDSEVSELLRRGPQPSPDPIAYLFSGSKKLDRSPGAEGGEERASEQLAVNGGERRCFLVRYLEADFSSEATGYVEVLKQGSSDAVEFAVTVYIASAFVNVSQTRLSSIETSNR
ncbi:hypothetical protein CB1_000318008 [Camelus ferus]|nr:hypothetical protein CB1_000318008 [Camelus ferus]